MRTYIRILPLLLAVLASAPQSVAADNEAAQPAVVQSESQSVFKGLFYKVWSRLRALSPTAKPAGQKVVATAGIRGNETTGSLMELYWKDDRTQDPDYLAELNQYAQAQQFVEKGDLPAAVKALSTFLDEHAESDLSANAQFALGLSYGGMGDKSSSVATLQSFLKQHPEHPLVADAQQVIAELK